MAPEAALWKERVKATLLRMPAPSSAPPAPTLHRPKHRYIKMRYHIQRNCCKISTNDAKFHLNSSCTAQSRLCSVNSNGKRARLHR